MRDAARIAAAFVAACRDELDAPKPGNVHLFADGHRMTAAAFVCSAEAAAEPLSAPGARVGARIFKAVEATRAAVATNTNLGIVLLCAPLAAAAESQIPDLRIALLDVLRWLDLEDADLAFRAIALAAPAGLGEAEHDVRAPATVTLAEAMAAAAGRDRVAHQFSAGFVDIFDRGLPAFDAAGRRWAERKWSTLAVYLGFLAAFPDTHVVRKYGAAVAEEVRQAAMLFERRLQTTDEPARLLADLLAWDRSLKQRAINPGTSADLTVATLFVHHLRGILPSARNSG